MKKILIYSSAAMLLGFASCSQDDIQAPAAGDGNVNLTLTVPANALGTRAFADGLTANDLEVAVFDKATGNLVISKEQKFAETGGALQTTVSLSLANGKSYQIAFFAHKKDGSAYTFDTTDKKVKVDYSKMNTSYNTDAFDCFYKLYETGTVTGPINETITLTRPVAQVNWGTSDLEEPVVTAADAYGAGAANLVTKITTKAYTEFDMLTSDVVTTSETDVVLPYLARPAATETFPYEPATYDYVSMQYLLVPAASSVVDLTLEASNSAAATQAITTVTVANAPVQANYRTNIFGALLTNSAEFDVEKEPNFDESDNNIKVPSWDGTVTIPEADANDENLFVISKASDLAGIAKMVAEGNTFAGKTIKLNSDIDLNNKEWTPIGSEPEANQFRGTFDGQGHTIKNLTMNPQTSIATGFIGFAGNGAVIKNFTIDGAKINTLAGLPAERGTGAAVGDAYVAKEIRNVTVKNAEIKAYRWAAGVVGNCGYTSVYDCTAENVTVTGSFELVKGEWDNCDKLGGVIGMQTEGKYTVSGNKAINVNVTGYRHIGTVAGFINYGEPANHKIVKDNSATGGSVTQTLEHNYKNIAAGELIGKIFGYIGANVDLDNNTETGVTLKTAE